MVFKLKHFSFERSLQDAAGDLGQTTDNIIHWANLGTQLMHSPNPQNLSLLLALVRTIICVHRSKFLSFSP